MPTFALNSMCQSNQEVVLAADIATRIIYSASSLLTAFQFHTSFSYKSRKTADYYESLPVVPVSPPPLDTAE